MGFDDVVKDMNGDDEEEEQQQQDNRGEKHPDRAKAMYIFAELTNKHFPQRLPCSDINVTDQFESDKAKAVKHDDGEWTIGLNSTFLEKAPEQKLRSAIGREMVHVWLGHSGSSKAQASNELLYWMYGKIGVQHEFIDIPDENHESVIESLINLGR